MTLDLRAIVRAVGGECLAQRVPEHTPVDGLARLGEYVVVGSTDFATLLTGPVDELRARLNAGGGAAEVTTRAVFVSGADDPDLRALLAEHRMTAILGAGASASGSASGDGAVRGEGGEAALHARVAARIRRRPTGWSPRARKCSPRWRDGAGPPP